MAQINLLKQSAPSVSLWQIVLKFLIRIFAILFFGLVIYYGWLFLQSKKIDTDISASKIKINADREAALTSPARDELLTRQTQLKDLNDLISAHLYLSQIFQKLAEATLKTATYSKMSLGNAGEIILSVNVPTLEDMDKYLQVFNIPDVNKNFSNVRIGAYHKIATKTSTTISFDVTMEFNPSIIKYNPSQASN